MQQADSLKKIDNESNAQREQFDFMFRQVYNYIFTVENLRSKSVISKIEKLFEEDPLKFDPFTVTYDLKKSEKRRQQEQLNRSAEQIYEEELKRQKQIKDQFESLIAKFDINVGLSNDDIPNNVKHCMKAMREGNSFKCYKEGKFFEHETIEEKKRMLTEKYVKRLIKNVEMQQELTLLERLMDKYMDPWAVYDLVIRQLFFIDVVKNQDRRIFSTELLK